MCVCVLQINFLLFNQLRETLYKVHRLSNTTTTCFSIPLSLFRSPYIGYLAEARSRLPQVTTQETCDRFESLPRRQIFCDFIFCGFSHGMIENAAFVLDGKKKRPFLSTFVATHISLTFLQFETIQYELRRSQWPRGLRRRCAAARLLRLWVRIPPGAWMSVCCECCVVSRRGL